MSFDPKAQLRMISTKEDETEKDQWITKEGEAKADLEKRMQASGEDPEKFKEAKKGEEPFQEGEK